MRTPWATGWVWGALGIIGVGIIAGAFGVGFWKRIRPPHEPALVPPPAVATTTPTLEIAHPATAGPAVQYSGEPVAVLPADPQFLATLPQETYPRARAELADLAVKLAAHSNQPELWLRVAYLKHFYNDDSGARDAYEYVNRIANGWSIPFYNLALIYAYNLHQPPKALPKFQAAIERDPRNVSFRIGLADFYREVARDLPAAERSLREAVAVVGTDANLSLALAALEKEMGNTTLAIAYYEQALQQPGLAAGGRQSISAEIERLRQSQPAP